MNLKWVALLFVLFLLFLYVSSESRKSHNVYKNQQNNENINNLEHCKDFESKSPNLENSENSENLENIQKPQNDNSDVILHNLVNDDENTHVSSIVNANKVRYNRLAELNDYPINPDNWVPDEWQNLIRPKIWYEKVKEDMFAEISNDLSKENLENNFAKVALKYFTESVMFLNPENPVPESWVLIQVWTRIQKEDNLELKKVFFSQLAECLSIVENSLEPVCSQGRVSRILDSFVLLSSDHELAKPFNTNLREEAFNLAYKISIMNLSKSEKLEKIESEFKVEYSMLSELELKKLINEAQAGIL